ncbi:succinate dehydrogenase subunit 4, mitochondrial-like [Lolium rigidum]|uniref:succinate dehydrogenase subunit 4, mitochondrial-like n=1 Tax=Lolium rigidum TaxID=89674 RepID=UPI001F5CB4F7|nr:succinate dehydrogenase subunit 4, mitochondrial-like [Lolium rigidum]
MASRFLARSRTLALALSRPDAAPAPLAGSRALSSLPRHPAAAAPSPAAGSPPRPGTVLGYEPTSHLSGTQFLPRWFSTVASNGSPMQKTQVSDELKATEGAFPKVVAFSPLEASIAKPRSSPLTSESSKVSRSEIATQVTFYMIPALLLTSRNSISTSLMVAAVYHQIYMFNKEIFLDYVHHDITRKWALIYFKLLLLVMAKDTVVYFNLF